MNEFVFQSVDFMDTTRITHGPTGLSIEYTGIQNRDQALEDLKIKIKNNKDGI